MNKGHGRIETQEGRTVTDLDCLDYLATDNLGTRKQWTGLRFREEQRRGRKDPASLRKIFHNLPKKEFSLKTDVQGKRLNAARRDDHLLKVLPGLDAIARTVDSVLGMANGTLGENSDGGKSGFNAPRHRPSTPNHAVILDGD